MVPLQVKKKIRSPGRVVGWEEHHAVVSPMLGDLPAIPFCRARERQRFETDSTSTRTVLILSILACALSCRPTVASLGEFATESGGSAVAGGSGGEASTTGGGGHGGTGNVIVAPRFGPAVLIPALLAAGQVTTDPTVSTDGLEMFFMSTRSGNKELHRTLRASAQQPWAAPTLVTELASDASDTNPRLSVDGLTLWFYSDRDRAQGTLWQSTRPSLSAPFGVPAIVEGLSAAGKSDVSACPNQSAKIAIVATLQDGVTQEYDLHEMRRDGIAAPFGLHSRLPAVNGPSDEFDPWLSPDGLHLVFHSSRSGDDDLYYTSRPTIAEEFGPPAPVGTLDTSASEVAPALSADRTRIWFSSTRDGDETIFEAELSP
jgi:hypothetical protein